MLVRGLAHKYQVVLYSQPMTPRAHDRESAGDGKNPPRFGEAYIAERAAQEEEIAEDTDLLLAYRFETARELIKQEEYREARRMIEEVLEQAEAADNLEMVVEARDLLAEVPTIH